MNNAFERDRFRRIRSDSYFVSHQPGNGTRYDFLITHLPENFPGCGREGGLSINLINFNRSMVLTKLMFVEWSYISEKFRLNKPEAEIVVDVINMYYEKLQNEEDVHDLLEV